MAFAYIAVLAFALFSMYLIDRRYKLAFFDNSKKTILTFAITIVGFVIWDVIGVALGIFYNGESSYDLGLFILPEVPIEEILFLTLLVYLSLIIYRLNDRWLR